LIEADEGVDFGEFAGEFGGESLGHAASDDEALIGAAAVEAAIAVGFENSGDAFGFGRVNEGAGIDDEDIGFGGVGGEFHAGGAKVAEHDFGIDEILSTTEGDETDFGGHGGRRMRVAD